MTSEKGERREGPKEPIDLEPFEYDFILAGFSPKTRDERIEMARLLASKNITPKEGEFLKVRVNGEEFWMSIDPQDPGTRLLPKTVKEKGLE